MLTQPNEPGGPIRSKAYEREMGLLFFVGTVAALIGLIYLLSFLGD